MLRTKCILAAIESDDGYRYSIMNRHTLEDGMSPNTEIHEGLFHAHWQQLAPSSQLLGDYYKRGLPWTEFKKRYLNEIRQPERLKYVHALIEQALESEVTVLCIETSPLHCHRRLLAEECQKISPKLNIYVR